MLKILSTFIWISTGNSDLANQSYAFSVRCPYESPARTLSSSGAGSGFSPVDYGSPPAAAAAAHLVSTSMVPDFSPVLELTK